MSVDPLVPPVDDLTAKLERALIEDRLTARGHPLEEPGSLPGAEAQAVLQDAVQYATGRLCEVESRAHLVSDLHAAKAPATGHPRNHSK